MIILWQDRKGLSIVGEGSTIVADTGTNGACVNLRYDGKHDVILGRYDTIEEAERVVRKIYNSIGEDGKFAMPLRQEPGVVHDDTHAEEGQETIDKVEIDRLQECRQKRRVLEFYKVPYAGRLAYYDEFDSIGKLAVADPERLQMVNGVGPRKAAEIIAHAKEIVGGG